MYKNIKGEEHVSNKSVETILIGFMYIESVSGKDWSHILIECPYIYIYI